MLTAGSAGSATISQAQLAAIKANGAKYHFEYLELNPGVPAEAAAIASLQAELMVPATAETAVVAGTASNPVGAVLLGGTAAVVLTANIEKMTGVFDEGDICNAPPGLYEAVDTALAAMTGTDCAQWQLEQDYLATANQDVPLIANFAIGSKSCIGNVCAVVASGPVTSTWASNGQWTGHWNYCLTSNVANAFTHVPLETSASPPSLSSSWGGGAQWSSTPAPHSGCSTVPGALSYANITGGGINAPIYTAWRANKFASEMALAGSPIRPDVARDFVCTVTFSGGGSVSRTSPAGQAGSGRFFKPECPPIPTDKVPVRTQIYLTSPTEGSILVFDQQTTAAYRAWKQTYPECGSGMCLLDLRSNGVSCFFEIVNCEGWFSEGARDTIYSCWYGSHAVALSECYVYRPTFYATNVLSGNAYADPATGEYLPEKTSTSPVEVIAQQLFDHGEGSVRDATSRVDWQMLEEPDRRRYAFAIAQQCVEMLGSDADRCLKAVWIPGSSVRDVAQHDLDAIMLGQPMLLTYVSGADKQAGNYQVGGAPGVALPRAWYTQAGLAPDSLCLGSTPDGQACDEFPYYATAESGVLGDLRYVDRLQNSLEGSLRSTMLYTSCNLRTAATAEDRQFVVVPLPDLPVTLALCGVGS